jgi:predicted nucleotidyltransferase component of viral defense system
MPKRKAPELEALVRVAAEESNCPLLLVEKDYWITMILKELVREFGDLIIFKGGTSLSKAWKLIDRFSEDGVPRKHGGYACNKTS